MLAPRVLGASFDVDGGPGQVPGGPGSPRRAVIAIEGKRPAHASPLSESSRALQTRESRVPIECARR
jgi:hypothetical protein